MGVVNVAAGLAILGAEPALPYRRRWRESRGDVKTDLGYLVMTGVALLLAGTPLTAAFTAAARLAGEPRAAARCGRDTWPRAAPAGAGVAGVRARVVQLSPRCVTTPGCGGCIPSTTASSGCTG